MTDDSVTQRFERALANERALLKRLGQHESTGQLIQHEPPSSDGGSGKPSAANQPPANEQPMMNSHSEASPIALALWAKHPAVVAMCMHADLGVPLMCNDHLDLGLLCEACLIEHANTDNHAVPDRCTMCGLPTTVHPSLLANLPHFALRTAHDGGTVVTATSPVLVRTAAETDAVYTGAIRLCFSAWLCDSCRTTIPPETLIMYDVSPSTD
jgi:hypothetical protein